jgi:chromosome partitioning protein
MAAAITPSAVPGLFVIPSSENLSGAEVELVSIDKREYKLRESMVRYVETEEKPFDFIIIDCPPSLGLLTLNAFVAADAVLVPLQCEFYALEGLSMLLKTVDRVRRAFNPSLEIQGIVLTMADKRNNLSEQVAEDVRAHLGEKVYKTVIPRNVRVSEAPSHGVPALVYDLQCAGSQAYIHLASEVIKRERGLSL